MSFELSNLINECAASYAGETECQNCVNGKNCDRCDTCKCYDSCIRPLHQYNSNGKTYNCPNMAYCYVVKHFYRFASEIEIAFRVIYNTEHQNWNSNINVVSLGCGPSSDEHIDILILNYLLSDVARNMQKEEKTAFLDKLAEFIDVMDIQYVIFNDIPLFYDNLISGYSCMEYVVRQFGVNKPRLSVLKGGRYRFGEPNQFQPTYGKKWNQSSLLFTIDDAANDFQPFCYCNSIQMLIKKDKSE